ncbi:MAG: TolC family protein [Syntrophobacteraceae bacterium]
MNGIRFEKSRAIGWLDRNRRKGLLKSAVLLFCFSFALASFANADPGAGPSHNPNYNSLSLEDCLSLARRYNPALRGSVEKIRELTADYRAARSQFFPQLTSLTYYQRLEPNRLPPGGAMTP